MEECQPQLGYGLLGEGKLWMACKFLQVDISGPWCTICRTADFELAFSLATVA
jgi:hypothetical protein